MPIQNMPQGIQAAIQQGFLERDFQEALRSTVGFRAIADKEEVAINVGETVIKTRNGLKAPAMAPMMPSANTNLDNGLNPSAFTIEQYALALNQYGDTIDLNIVTSQVGIGNQFLLNTTINGIQARQTLDRLARNALYSAYLGGNTRVRVSLTSAGPNIAVDDVRGFLTVLNNGQFLPVSPTNTAQVVVGANVYTLIGVTPDQSSVSSVLPGTTGISGQSGLLTFATNVATTDATAGNLVAHANGPVVVRPNGKWGGGASPNATTASLATSDTLTLGAIEDAVAQLRANTGMLQDPFFLYLDTFSMRQLFSDPDFKLMYQGQYGSEEVRTGKLFQLFGVNFVPTNEAPVQPASSAVPVRVRRPILCAPGVLIEGDFAGMREKAYEVAGSNSEVQMLDGIMQVVRAPLDRLQQIVAQSWFWIGGFVAPTDATATSVIIPSAGAQYLKRAVVIEHVG